MKRGPITKPRATSIRRHRAARHVAHHDASVRPIASLTTTSGSVFAFPFVTPAGVTECDMPSTHVSLHYHVVFSTKNRLPLIAADWRESLHADLGGCLRGLGGVALQVGGVADHVHLLIGLKAVHAPADIVREVKKASTSWIRESAESRFQWQEGYGAFTVSRHDLEALTAYVASQEASSIEVLPGGVRRVPSGTGHSL